MTEGITLRARHGESAGDAGTELRVGRRITIAATSSDTAEPFCLAQYHHVSGAIELGGERVCVGAGDIVFGDRSIGPALGDTPPPGWTAWTMPRSIMQPALATGGGRHRILRGGEPLGAIAGACLMHLDAAIDDLGPAAAVPLMATLAAMLALHISSEGRAITALHVSTSPDRLAMIEQSIATCYVDTTVSPRRMAAAHDISVRTMNLLFQRSGTTFNRRLLETRLTAAHAILTDPAEHRRTVTDIAFSCGFEAVSTFYRAFRERYDYSPNALRAGR